MHNELNSSDARWIESQQCVLRSRIHILKESIVAQKKCDVRKFCNQITRHEKKQKQNRKKKKNDCLFNLLAESNHAFVCIEFSYSINSDVISNISLVCECAIVVFTLFSIFFFVALNKSNTFRTRFAHVFRLLLREVIGIWQARKANQQLINEHKSYAHFATFTSKCEWYLQLRNIIGYFFVFNLEWNACKYINFVLRLQLGKSE